MVYFRANVASPVRPEWPGLPLKTAGVADAVRPLVGGVVVRFVRGSVAAGTEEADTDVDLFVVSTSAPADLAVPRRQAWYRPGLDVNPTVRTPAEFAARRGAPDPFLTRVLDRPKLFVGGNADDLAAVG